MTYSDPEKIIKKLGSLYKTDDGEPGEITDEDIADAMNDAYITIKSELTDEGLTPPADDAEKIDDLRTAEKLLALSDLLDTYYQGTDGNRAASAGTFETRAYKLINNYINRPSTESDERSPRIRSFIAGTDQDD